MRLMTENESRSARLRDARQKAGFSTAAEAARKFGWPYPTYVMHESGRGLGRSAAVYAHAFNVSETWLMTGHGAGLTAGANELVSIYEVLPQDYRDLLLADARVFQLAAGRLALGVEAPKWPLRKGRR
jgi:hypothetical protein